MNRSAFFAALRARRLFGSTLSQGQVDGMEAILNEAENRGTKLQHLAYMLATTLHETAHTMQPIEEYGKGKGRKYGQPAGPYKKRYYGRGFVQLTWLFNYEKATEELNYDLVQFPERAMELSIATAILFAGMEHAWFTGKKLSDYIDIHGADYKNARRVINGTDKAAQIAGYAKSFEAALRKAGYGSQAHC